MNDNRPEDEEHFSHTGATDRHFLLAFFDEPLMEFLKGRNSGNTWDGVEVEDLAKPTG